MKPLDLRKLTHAIVLAEETTFVRASKRLHISQPALTRSIQSLEADLGLQLFDRQLPGAIPTSQGRVVLKKAEQLLLQSQILHKEINLLKGQDAGQLAFGIGTGIQNPILDQLLEAIFHQPSLYTVEVEVEPISRLLAMLHKQNIEFFIGDKGQIKPADRKHLLIKKLTTSNGGFFVRSNHPLASLTNFPLDKVSAFPAVATRVDDNEWQQQGKFERKYLKTDNLRRRIVCNDIAALKTITLKTDAILVTTDAMVADEIAAGTIKELQFNNPGFSTEREICLVTTSGKTQSGSARLVLELIHKIVEELNPKTA